MEQSHNGKSKFPYTAEDLAIYMLDYLDTTRAYLKDDTDTEHS